MLVGEWLHLVQWHRLVHRNTCRLWQLYEQYHLSIRQQLLLVDHRNVHGHAYHLQLQRDKRHLPVGQWVLLVQRQRHVFRDARSLQCLDEQCHMSVRQRLLLVHDDNLYRHAHRVFYHQRQHQLPFEQRLLLVERQRYLFGHAGHMQRDRSGELFQAIRMQPFNVLSAPDGGSVVGNDGT